MGFAAEPPWEALAYLEGFDRLRDHVGRACCLRRRGAPTLEAAFAGAGWETGRSGAAHAEQALDAQFVARKLRRTDL